MDVTKIVEFDKGIKWKRLGGDNPYALVLKAKRIWHFTEQDNQNKYTFMKLLIQDNAIEFRWGLQKQKKIMIFYHKKYAYFVAPPNEVYKVELPENKKKKKIIKRKDNQKDVFVK